MGVDMNLVTRQCDVTELQGMYCSLEQQRMTDLPEVVERGLHLYHHLQHVHGLARLLEEPHCELAHLRCRVIQLREEKLQHPCVRDLA